LRVSCRIKPDIEGMAMELSRFGAGAAAEGRLITCLS